MSTFLTYYRNPDFYRARFGKESKKWNLEMIHDLWLRAKKRDEKYYQQFSSYINEVVAEIPADERGSHRVYFKHKRSHNQDDLHYYSLKYEHIFKSYSYSTDLFKIETRDDKLISIIQGKPFEMGQKLYYLEQLCSRKSHNVKHIMWELVQDQLREKFKNTRPSKAFTIELGSSKYTVICDDIYSYYYKFDLVESIIDPVIINTQI